MSLIPISTFLLFLFAIRSISKISLLDSALISNIFFLIAYSISFEVFPTPENTILFGFIPDFNDFINSPIETTSAPKPNFPISPNKVLFGFDFTEKQIIGFIDLKFSLKFKILCFNFLNE